MNHTEFDVIRFENRNGITSWRVAGWLHGVRIRKNFKTREEAAAEKATLEIKAIQAASGLRSVATSLSDGDVREAEALFRRIAGKPHPLSFYVDYALAHYHEKQEERKLLDQAVADYVSAKTHEFEQDQISRPQLKRIKWELKRLQAHFPGQFTSEITANQLVTFLEIGRPSLKTFNNRRGVYSTFFKHAFQRGWIAENPVPRVPHHRIRRRRGLARTFTAAQARSLMEFLEGYEGGRWVPYFALCLFAGVRPGVPDGEITKLKPEAVCLETGTIHISAEVSKVREPRKIAIQPHLAAWLRAYPLDKLPIVVGNFKKRRQKFKDKFQLTHDVLRHTFISMFVAKFRSIGEAAIQAGNSESIIRKHYLDLKSRPEAEDFFNILPKRVFGSSTPNEVGVRCNSDTGACRLERLNKPAIRTFLLTWGNFEETPDSEIDAIANQLGRTKTIEGQWSSGNRKDINVGERVFLLRQGTDMPGLVGWGTVSKEPFEAEHWDPVRQRKGVTANYIMVHWREVVPKDAGVPRARLVELGIPESLLNAQGSGVIISEDILPSRLHAHLHRKPIRFPCYGPTADQGY